MAWLTYFPKEVEILISNYESKFIILCDNINWHNLIKHNFGLEFSASIPQFELRALYIEKCYQHKFMFNDDSYAFIIYD